MTIRSGLNGWYFANFFPAVIPIGFLIIDPLTGAVHILDPQKVNVTLAQKIPETDKEQLLGAND